MRMVRYMSSEGLSEITTRTVIGCMLTLCILVGIGTLAYFSTSANESHVIKIGVLEKRDIGGIKYLKLVSSHYSNGEMVYDFDNLDEVYDSVEVNKSYDATIMYPSLRITKIDGMDVDHT